MGSYINPPADTKEQAWFGKSDWLATNGKELDKAPAWEDIPPDLCAVCCVLNSAFEAAAIVLKPDDVTYFASPADYRPKRWFLLSKELAVKHGDVELGDFS